jgi:hypothetical protein
LTLIHPKEQQKLEEMKMMQTALLESLVNETRRVRESVAYQDFEKSLISFNSGIRTGLVEQTTICDEFGSKLK